VRAFFLGCFTEALGPALRFPRAADGTEPLKIVDLGLSLITRAAADKPRKLCPQVTQAVKPTRTVGGDDTIASTSGVVVSAPTMCRAFQSRRANAVGTFGPPSGSCFVEDPQRQSQKIQQHRTPRKYLACSSHRRRQRPPVQPHPEPDRCSYT
jgi:hypothetical protein